MCEFIEGENGLIYFNEAKAFECDFKFDGEPIKQAKPTLNNPRLFTHTKSLRTSILLSNEQDILEILEKNKFNLSMINRKQLLSLSNEQKLIIVEKQGSRNC